jgi:hypothetical protein
VFGEHEDRAPALAEIVSYVRVWGAERELRRHGALFFTHLLGEAQLKLLVPGQPWMHQTRPFVQHIVHRQRVVLVEKGAFWLT